MELLSYFWEHFLYAPLFNFLIWLYINYANYNLGVAVIYLTISLRVVLLPFTVLVERGKVVGEQLEKEAEQIRRDYAQDQVKQRQAIRQLLKRKRIRPWAKAVVLGVQALVLVLLYRVIVDGIRAEHFYILYDSITLPDFINSDFFWLDIGQRDLLAAAIVAGYVFAEILIGQWVSSHKQTIREQLFMILFPAFTFLALAVLPSAKSIFILTSLIFSTIISGITSLFSFALSQRQTVKKNS